MPSMLQAMAIGHAGSDAEAKYTTAGTQMATFSLAVNDGRKQADGTWLEQTIWVRVTYFGNLAEKALAQVSKGAIVVATGRLSARPWMRQSGEPQAGIELTGSTLLVMNRRGEEPAERPSQPAPRGQEGANDDDGMPF